MIDINTPADFEAHVTNGKKVILDFWAPWCGPCRAMMPALEQLEKDDPSIVVAKVNIDENQALAAAYRIRSVPTLALVVDGQLMRQEVGQKSLTQLKQFAG